MGKVDVSILKQMECKYLCENKVTKNKINIYSKRPGQK